MDYRYLRIGQGYDTHRLVEGRKLILGGLELSFSKGLEGHSDADVLLHAVIDAILGATAQGDIGRWFPNTDPKFKNASSIDLLQEVWLKTQKRGWEIINLDSVVCAEAPRLAPHIDGIQESIAGLLGCRVDQINVKATTGEKMGFVGRGEGISAWATILLFNSDAANVED